MRTFTPPTSDDVPRIEASTRGSAARLFAFFPTHRRGVNVYKYVDGSYSTADPLDTSAPVVTYYGGHVYTVDDTEAAALTAAGYGSWLGTPPTVTEATAKPRTFDANGRML